MIWTKYSREVLLVAFTLHGSMLILATYHCYFQKPQPLWRKWRIKPQGRERLQFWNAWHLAVPSPNWSGIRMAVLSRYCFLHECAACHERLPLQQGEELCLQWSLNKWFVLCCPGYRTTLLHGREPAAGDCADQAQWWGCLHLHDVQHTGYRERNLSPQCHPPQPWWWWGGNSNWWLHYYWYVYSHGYRNPGIWSHPIECIGL